MSIEKIKKASEFIKLKIKEIPEVLVILGSGLGSLAEDIQDKIEINYNDIPGFPVSTVEGHVGQFVYGSLGGKKVIMMQGRFHFYEGYEMSLVTFPIRVMAYIGVKKLIVTNAAGGVNTSFKPGDLMIIKDHINMSGTNPLIGKNLDEFGARFPDMSNAYDRQYTSLVKKIALELEVEVVEGVYVMMTGPTYETPAEVRMLRVLGADATGMSTVPEVIVAKHSGMNVLGISCITNMAAGILDKPLSHDEVIETSNLVKEKFKLLIKNIVSEI
ncbi:purine-nucleoside phosphorylase [Clostridium cylindrosporum]|uniref:Purine nucleoside phosphorylase n=1 Tax=Clostridium cylindrosporum DSM 605 TaxID=1121307 RepID=A0A0J8D5D7_CLOCY|nr:purine-nucleoside phosphorylase [Clostridium cylindrosporum]KMT21365.1 purine nucleoside phosphorylase 1 [Clostridium cylindrosporum DSM 605]